MKCEKCGEWISVDDYLAYDGLCPYCDEERENEQGPGVTYIASDLGAFKRVYDRFKEEVFKPAAMALPSGEELREKNKHRKRS